ncbi:MAG: response regulator transcription factor [Saprospiraceae bacterium]|nr:response regulator transcription factor [Bacteroidia bacterium]MBT8230397.1 response regulator transcription factor [Bacteroidia bacterium]NNF20510.1 response regulator transcription factor [Saprospiraceae bacterium]NNK89458.1 response regulator transcription factor [Saprospiraceae bacterium]
MSETITQKILLVEDDQNFGDVLRSYLEMHDYEVDLAKDGEEGLMKYNKGSFDLCILDVMMPKKDGFTLAKDIREKDKDIPLIFLTAKSLKEDVLEGFKIGADDYITKPFNSEELLLRVQAILRRSGAKPDPKDDVKEFLLGDFHFNYPLRILTFNGSKEHHKDHLSPKEAHLLRLFCVHKNDVLPRSLALTKIWGEDNYFTARSMDVFVTKLRKYLSRDEKLEIVNIHGNGFRLIDRSVEVVE